MPLRELKKLLPAANRYHFFNYAATSPMLKPCADRMIELVQEGLEPLSMHFEKWIGILESARHSVANTIHASSEEIAFTTSTSSALSLAARSISWRPEDRVLYPANDFPSNRYIWESLGVQAEAIYESDFIQAVLDRDLSQVKLVALSAVSYLDGKKHDIAKLTKHCHSKGILVAVDAIQAIGAIPVNMDEWGCDFLACGGQKWLLGPVGSGFLYVNKNVLPKLTVPLIGWASSKDAGNFDVKVLEYVDGARRFEPGLPDIPAIAGLAKSLDVFAEAGWSKIFKQIEEISSHIRKELSSIGYDIANKDESSQSGIVTLNFKSEEDAKALYQQCIKEKIILTQKKNQLRIASHAMVSEEDVGKLLKVFKKESSLVALSPYKIKDKVTPPNFLTAGFKWKKALITGAGQGLGAALAFSLARRGCHVTLLGRKQEMLAQVAQEISKRYPVEVKEVVLDLSKPEWLNNWLVDLQESDFDLIVNNAAWAEGGHFVDSEIVDYRNALETNFFAPLLITQKFLPHMLKNKHGAVLNVATSGARCALPFFTAYTASKGALWSWSEALSRELEGSGVHVMTFIPPSISTLTNWRLGRKALAHYNTIGQKAKSWEASQVAEEAINSLVREKKFAASLSVKIKIALNSLFYNQTTKKILGFWKVS